MRELPDYGTCGQCGFTARNPGDLYTHQMYTGHDINQLTPAQLMSYFKADSILGEKQ